MECETLESLAKSRQWSELECEWLKTIEKPGTDPARLLSIIDLVVKAGQGDLAETLGWAWLTVAKESQPPADALQLGRGLLLRLPAGEDLREEILSLYRQTHQDRPGLEEWIERSGLKSGKSVRRALRFLETGLRLGVGTYLMDRTQDVAAQITAFDVDEDLVAVKTARRSQQVDIAHLIDTYDLADENDFRVLSQLRPERIAELAEQDPTTLAVGVLLSHGNRIDRDALKLLLVPRHLPAKKWTDWWAKVRNGVKRSPHLRIEGRSPVFLVYDEAGQSLETEVWSAFAEAHTPRQWLDLLEGYLRDTKQQKSQPDTALLNRIQEALVRHIERFTRHKEPAVAFATALVLERVAADGLPVSADTHGMALDMLKEADDPVAIVASVPDMRLWSLAVACVEQSFPETYPEPLSELILFGQGSQCDALAKKVEAAGRGDLLPSIVERATADPERFTGATMWVWNVPGVEMDLPLPPLLETLNLILGMVGPTRTSAGASERQTVNELRAKVRTGLTAKGCASYRKCIEQLDLPLAQTVRRQIERADGLGPRAQDNLMRLLRVQFPDLYVKIKVEMWDDPTVLYFSESGLRAKENDLHEIVNVKMRENAKAIGEAAARGDLSENAEYKFALEERDLLRARVAQINKEVSLARVLHPHDVPTNHVGIGQRITLRPTAGGEPVQMSVTGIGDTDLPNRAYSYQTPLARQILGKRIGEVVTMTIDEREGEFKIEQVECAIQ